MQEYWDVKTAEIYPAKQYVLDWIKQPKVFNKYAKIADAIWSYAELGMQEFKSVKLLTDNLEAVGFKVERGLAGMPTCFIATYGSGKPVIGILGEFDALPMLSQEGGNPNQAPLVKGAPGHGCGHNLMCTAASATAEAIKNAMDKFGIKGTIKVFGCPAEETTISRPFMVKAGLFDDVDVVIDNHGDEALYTEYGKAIWTALFSSVFSFKGLTAHSAGMPWAGKSALDAVEIMDVATNFLREHLFYTNRMHYVITSGGEAPNVVPDKASVWYFVRNIDALIEGDYAKVVNCAKAAALATGTELSIRVLTAIHQGYCSESLAKVIQSNIQLVGMPEWTEEENVFAKTLQKSLGQKETELATSVRKLGVWDSTVPYLRGGSSDVGEVTLVAPCAAVKMPTQVPNVIWHHWSITTVNNTSIAHKGMNCGAQTMAATALDLFTKPDMLQAIRAEFEEQYKKYPYKTLLPEGTTPPTDLNAELMAKYAPLLEPYYTKADIIPIGPEISK